MPESQDILARLRCYEPAGKVLDLTVDTVLKHILATGATGAGKTSALIDPCIEQFMKFAGGDPNRRLGLLILDPKGDGGPKVAFAARKANRQGDLRVLGQGFHYDPFHRLTSLDQVEHFTEQLLSGSADMGAANVYWEEARRGLIASALCLLVANDLRTTFAQAMAFLHSALLSPKKERLFERGVRFVQALLKVGKLTEPTRRRLGLALRDLELWDQMDSRLRESHRSCITNAFRPLLNPMAQRLFEGVGQAFCPDSALEGRILLVSLDAQVYPQLASLVFRLIKRDFFRAVHQRRAVDITRDRLCILVVDEYCLAAEIQDIEDLSTCRSRGAGVLAATQGLSAIDERLGRRRRDSLLANFGSVFFFPNRERAADEEAFLRLGYHSPREGRERASEKGHIAVVDPSQALAASPLCEPGTLSRLATHHAYASLADGSRTTTPVWLAPCFYPIPVPEQPGSQENDLACEVSRLRAILVSPPDVSLGSRLVQQMHERGHRLWLTPKVVEALLGHCLPSARRDQLVDSLVADSELLVSDRVPSCWLAGVLGLVHRTPSLRGCLLRLDAVQGVLCAEFTSESAAEGFALHELINKSIYPSLWRPAKARHLGLLWKVSPELRPEIRGLPQLARRPWGSGVVPSGKEAP